VIKLRRTQLYLDDELHRLLSALSRQEKKSLSELVRSAIADKYVKRDVVDKIAIVDRLAGIWKDREDMKSPERYIRILRKDRRRDRLVNG